MSQLSIHSFPGADVMTASGVFEKISKHGKSYGFYALHRQEYLTVKEEQKKTQTDRRVAARWKRWDRKEPQNRVSWKQLRDSSGQRCGWEKGGEIPEPPRAIYDAAYRETVLELLQLTRRPYRSRVVAQAVRAAAMPLLKQLEDKKEFLRGV